jgi:pyruvate formate lyase activating enzyme
MCWETNGTMHPALLEEMADVSLATGGCIKFDLKAWNEDLSLALCGRSNQQTIANFEKLASLYSLRTDPPLVVASTLLIPGYIEAEEVYAIASFIAKLNPNIPYSLLAFSPQFHMADLPTTSRTHVDRCLEAAQRAGLRSINVGNPHLFV